VLSYLLLSTSYERVLEHEKEQRGHLRLGLNVPNSRSSFQCVGRRFSGAVSPRVFGAWWTWRKAPGTNGAYLVALSPPNEYTDNQGVADEVEKALADAASSKGAVRGSVIGLCVLAATEASATPTPHSFTPSPLLYPVRSQVHHPAPRPDGLPGDVLRIW
jgi:hypothetical protein